MAGPALRHRLATQALIVATAPFYAVAVLQARVAERRHALDSAQVRADSAEAMAAHHQRKRRDAEASTDELAAAYADIRATVVEEVRTIYGPSMASLLEELIDQATADRLTAGRP